MDVDAPNAYETRKNLYQFLFAGIA